MRIVVQYALRRTTNLSEVLLCHQKKKNSSILLATLTGIGKRERKYVGKLERVLLLGHRVLIEEGLDL